MYFFSSNTYTAFPLVVYAEVEWASRFPALWLMPGVEQRMRTRPEGGADAGALVGTVDGVFLYLYSDPVATVTVMGVNAVTFFGFAIGYHLKHTHIWLMFPRGIREHISSPAMHLIHHSKDPRHYDMNMARVFTIWDRLAGTLYIPEEYEEIECGMGDDEHLEFDSVWQLYVLPFKNVARRWLPAKVTAG